MKNFKIVLTIVTAFAAGFIVSTVIHKDKHVQEAQEEAGEENGVIKVTKDSQGLLNMETAEVKKAPLLEKLPVTGQIAQDVEQTNYVAAPKAGVVVENTAQLGAIVKKGDILCRIKPDDEDAVIDVKSPYEGVVIADFDKVGEKVETVSSLCAIADLSKIWANFDIYEKDLAKIKVDQKIVVHALAYPQESFEGKVVFISPRVDDTTRTIKIRALVYNPEYLLKLGMFVNAEIISESDQEYLTLPVSAVQTLGDKKIVFVKMSDQEFQMREVKIQSQTIDQVAISEGVNAGEKVATQGSFLLKSGLLKDELEGE